LRHLPYPVRHLTKPALQRKCRHDNPSSDDEHQRDRFDLTDRDCRISELPHSIQDIQRGIATATLSRLAEFRQNVADNSAARDATSHGEAALPMSDYSFWQPGRRRAST